MAVFKINQEEINQYLARYEGNTPLVVFPRGGSLQERTYFSAMGCRR